MAIFVFDAYGTLFNVHGAIARFRGQAGPEADRMSELWRAKQLEYSWTLTLAGRYTDFWALTERALDYSLARCPSVEPGAAAGKLLEGLFRGGSIAFPDARTALRAAGSQRPQDRHPVERLARHAQGRGRRRKRRRRSRRRCCRVDKLGDAQATAGSPIAACDHAIAAGARRAAR